MSDRPQTNTYVHTITVMAAVGAVERWSIKVDARGGEEPEA